MRNLRYLAAICGVLLLSIATARASAFLLELLVFPFAGASDHTTDYIEHKDKRPELVLQSVRDFASPEYGVDIYKLESPLAGIMISRGSRKLGRPNQRPRCAQASM